MLLTPLEPAAVQESLLPVLPTLAAHHRVVLASVQDPALAAEAVAEFHDRLQQPRPTSFDTRIDRLNREVRARADVRAAFDAVGRAFAIPTLSSQF